MLASDKKWLSADKEIRVQDTGVDNSEMRLSGYQ
jgi:hypothetical protein